LLRVCAIKAVACGLADVRAGGCGLNRRSGERSRHTNTELYGNGSQANSASLVNLPVLWMAILVFGFMYLVTAGVYATITTAPEPLWTDTVEKKCSWFSANS